MKRPGDEPSPTLQPASKLQKSVTFSFPIQSTQLQAKETISTPYPSSSSTSLPSASPVMQTGNTYSQLQPSQPPQGRLMTEGGGSNNKPSILRSGAQQTNITSNSSQQQQQLTAVTPSPRFTFDFVDDTLSLSTSARSSRSPTSATAIGGYRKSNSTAKLLSPTRLDTKYSSRLPPSYNGNNHCNSVSPSFLRRSYSSPINNRGDDEEAAVKRNLFGGTGGGGGGRSVDTTNTTSIKSLNSGVMAMDVSSDYGGSQHSAASGNNNTPNNSVPNTPSRGVYGRSASDSSSPYYYSNNHRWGSGSSNSGQYSPAASRSNSVNLSVATGGSNASSTRSSTVSSFINSSPRKRGMVTGVTSPLSGNLSHQASICSSAASSPAANSVIHGGVGPMMTSSNYSAAGGSSSAMTNTTAGGTSNNSNNNGMLIDYETRSGAGDRYIPSRAISNFNFDLKTGGRNVHTVTDRGTTSTVAGGGGSGSGSGSGSGNGGGGSSSGNNNDVYVSINPQPSFGATMMGGGTITTEAPGASSPARGGGRGATPPDVSATPSDDDDAEPSERHDASNRQPVLYDALLRSELLGENIDPAAHNMQSPTGLVNANIMNNCNIVTPFRERSNNLRFNPTRLYYHNSMFNNNGREEITRENEHSSIVNSFQLSPVSLSSSQRTNLGSYTERCKRKIAKVPTKVLDAPALQDDFYLNLVDWSSQNVLAVGLGSCVYLWSAATSRVTQLCDLSSTEDAVTSVSWSEGGKHLAIGSTRGDVQLWDAGTNKLVRTMTGHTARVGALSWKLSGALGGASSQAGAGSNSLLASGSRDRLIHLRDPRSDSSTPEMRLCAHKQEVCGLRWSFDERSMLASGGNDNKLLVWDIKKHTQPIHTFADHTAAVKAIAWSPHQHGLLASGGGTADRCIRFWNCLTGHGINCIDTGSQVCNLAFSKNCNELVSTHGYSLNQIVVWKYPSMQKIATLTGHTYRVLYLALSPDGSTIVTGAGDETLRFWQVFPGPQKENKAGGLLFPAAGSSVIR